MRESSPGRGRHDPRWRERYAAQLGTPEEAVGIVEDGDTVYAGTWTSVPTLLCAALAARAGTIRGVTVSTGLLWFPRSVASYRAFKERFESTSTLVWRVRGMAEGRLGPDIEIYRLN